MWMLLRGAGSPGIKLRNWHSPLGHLACTAAALDDVHALPTPQNCAARRGLTAGAAAAASVALPPLEPWLHAGQPIERSSTPPSSWYTDPAVLEREERTVFRHSWLAVAPAGRLAAPGAYATGSLLRLRWLACRDEHGRLHAFHNVCRHHAAILAEGYGSAACFRCPYHGWTYGLDGRLQRATRLGGIQGFRAADHGLLPLEVQEWGGLVWLRQQQGPPPPSQQQKEAAQQRGEAPRQDVAAWLGTRGAAAALAAGIGDELAHVASRRYTIQCNHKVFVDNYLDGGYHVSVAHPQLASGLDLSTYRCQLYDERLSIQSCQPAGGGEAATGCGEAWQGRPQRRVSGGGPVAYVFVYPNLMLNRYGPWLDTNTVVPLAADRCQVLFEYFLEPGLAGDAAYVADSLAASHQVQLEDIALCESVQRGLASSGYDTGRYAPGVEAPMHHFHTLLHAELQGAPDTA